MQIMLLFGLRSIYILATICENVNIKREKNVEYAAEDWKIGFCKGNADEVGYTSSVNCVDSFPSRGSPDNGVV